jgi:hypothetical protein
VADPAVSGFGFDPSNAKPVFDVHKAQPVAFNPSAAKPVGNESSGGMLSHDQIADLWKKAGGDPRYADIMAHVAYAESGGNPDSNQSGATNYQENGKTYYPQGLWQISTVHGYKESMFDPMANAKRAVELFGKGNFGPWEASRKGGAGGGWGQYLSQHQEPEHLQKLPPGGMAAVLHATPAAPYHVTREMEAGFLSGFADAMEGALRGLHDLSSDVIKQVTGTPEFALGTIAASHTPGRQAIQSRLSPVLGRIGEAADAFTAAPANAGLRALGGDQTAWDQYVKTVQRPFPGAGSFFEGQVRALNPFVALDYADDIGKRLDEIGKLGFNSPEDILYWSRQPGVLERVGSANPTTPGGKAVQLALGMHADLARLKPGHPYLSGGETGLAEFFNPSYLAAGAAGGMLSRGFMGELRAARLGQYGAGSQKLAKLLANSPGIGNRFVGMGDESGLLGEQWHANAARHMSSVSNEAQATLTGLDTYNGLSLEDQVNVKHLIEHPEGEGVDQMGMPTQRDPKWEALANKKVGGLTLGERAANVRARTRATEDALRSASPAMAAKLLHADEYTTHNGAWKEQYAQGPPPGGGGGTGNPIGSQHRTYKTLEEGQQNGRELDPAWVPSGADAMHESKLRTFITFMSFIKQLEKMPMRDGKMHLFDINYKNEFTNADGSTYKWYTNEKGLAGYKEAERQANSYAQARATTMGARMGWSDEQTAGKVADYRREWWDKARTQFLKEHPNHSFDPHTWLGIEDLQGKAMSNASLNAAIDVHPSLSRNWKGTPEQYEKYLAENPSGAQGAHLTDPDPGLTPVISFENINALVRQGLITGAGYHGFVNLAPNVLSEGVNPVWVARALGIDRSTPIPQKWLDDVAESGAVPKNYGTGLHLDPRLAAKLLTVPYKGLDNGEKFLKGIVQGSKWNQKITLDYQEHRLAAVTMHHFREKGMSREEAARRTSRLLNDSQNMTASERQLGLRNWTYFYAWVKGQMRWWTQQAIENPKKIMAPIQGVQTANQQQGDQGAVAGGSLSLRSALNALHYGWGTDEHGNPRYVSLPGPMIHFGSTIMRMAGGMADPLGEPLKAFEQRATSSLTPLAGMAMGVESTLHSDAALPEGYNDVLWDKDAPSAATKWLQFGNKVFNPTSGMYAPAALRSPTLGIGPNIYSEPNYGTATEKAQYMAMKDLRTTLESSNKQGNRLLSEEIYSALLHVANGDPAAIQSAKANLSQWKKQLGIAAPHTRRYGAYTPRF